MLLLPGQTNPQKAFDQSSGHWVKTAGSVLSLNEHCSEALDSRLGGVWRGKILRPVQDANP
ncbi:hypothetical protein PVE_R2G0290 [Pseudomonas veronii 1YdBTEX2]|uniref:Uncharacterized protein n=1 Tax=Pseudomonas veronii 1YdBTEX2 TaxID=1295141 RepID=A0A1D3K7K4_PSEVE|nr:hypothetical protein PVE_R2G0290 [Pseudomonas veronii 1YdBTEX2]